VKLLVLSVVCLQSIREIQLQISSPILQMLRVQIHLVL